MTNIDGTLAMSWHCGRHLNTVSQPVFVAAHKGGAITPLPQKMKLT